jgi:MFS family permease
MVLACYVAFAALGWFLNGFGSILPELEDDIGERASIYPLLPGAVLLVWGLIVVRRHRGIDGPSNHALGVIAGSIALAVGLVVMGITRWLAVSAIGALAASIAAAYLIRLLPAVLATIRAEDTERVMMRSNAYSSVAALVAPLAVGLSIAVGTGWLPGMAIPIGIAAVAVVITARPSLADPPPVRPVEHDLEPSVEIVPPLRAWWREFTVLGVSIMIEFCFVYFAATFLHDELDLSTAAAAAGAGAWGIGMATGRFAVSTWPPPRTVLPSVVGIAIGFVMLWGVPNAAVAIAGIGVAGLGASPLYPSRLTALLDRFPSSPHEGSARGSLASGAALMAAPALMAGMRAISDVRMAYLAIPVLLVVLLALANPFSLGRRRASPRPSPSS